MLCIFYVLLLHLYLHSGQDFPFSLFTIVSTCTRYVQWLFLKAWKSLVLFILSWWGWDTNQLRIKPDRWSKSSTAVTLLYNSSSKIWVLPTHPHHFLNQHLLFHSELFFKILNTSHIVKRCSERPPCQRTNDYTLAKLIKQSTWYLRQVSLIAASAWPSSQGFHFSHSPAISNWNRATATCSERETERVRQMEREALWRFSPPSLGTSIYPWYHWLIWDGVSLWIRVCLTVRCLWVQGGTADYPARGIYLRTLQLSRASGV